MIESIDVSLDLGVAGPRPTALRRLVMVSDDAEFCSVMRDALAESHEVVHHGPATPMTSLADARPGILALGPISPSLAGSSLSVWELVALARSHRDLRSVPIVVLTAEFEAVMGEPGLLSRHEGVHAIGIPLDLDTLTSVLKSIEREPHHRPANRVPDVCIHGYEFGLDGPVGCDVCSWSAVEPDD